MADHPVDDWPNYEGFAPGPLKQLHAVGVIASCYNAFERILFDIYLHHLDRKKIPRVISEPFYLLRDEEHRITAIKDVFLTFEKSKKVTNRIENLADYFRWCSEVRNNVLHGEVYSTFLADQVNINLRKRKGRRTAEVGFLSLDLPGMRECADQIAEGRLQAAKINLHLLFRDTAPARRSLSLRTHGPEPLPKILQIPKRQLLLPHPHTGPIPPFRLRASSEKP